MIRHDGNSPKRDELPANQANPLIWALNFPRRTLGFVKYIIA